MTHLVAEDIRSAPHTVVTARGDAVVVAIDGDLDIAAVPAVRERPLGLLRPGASRLVIDMSAVRYADASGLEVLVSTRRRAVPLGGMLHLAALQPEVARVLIVTGLGWDLGTYPTVRAAVADRRPGIRIALPGTGPPDRRALALPVQAQAGLAPTAMSRTRPLPPCSPAPARGPTRTHATAGRLRRLFAARPRLAVS